MNEHETLAVVARKAQDRSKGDFRAAVRMLVAAVMMDARLLLELLGLTREKIEARCVVYLRGLTTEVIPKCVPAERKQSRQAKKVAQATRAIARDIAKGTDSATGFAERTKAATAAVGSAITAVRSVFDETITATTSIKWGDITRYDYLNLRIRNAFTQEIERELSTVNWPDEHTPLRDFAELEFVAKMRDRANAAREKAVERVKIEHRSKYSDGGNEARV